MYTKVTVIVLCFSHRYAQLSDLLRSFYSLSFFFFNDTATSEIYTLSLHDALPICCSSRKSVSPVILDYPGGTRAIIEDRKSTRLNSSHVSISYAVFCLKKKNRKPVGLPQDHGPHSFCSPAEFRRCIFRVLHHLSSQ